MWTFLNSVQNIYKKSLKISQLNKFFKIIYMYMIQQQNMKESETSIGHWLRHVFRKHINYNSPLQIKSKTEANILQF